jgi:hypothetical protein
MAAKAAKGGAEVIEDEERSFVPPEEEEKPPVEEEEAEVEKKPPEPPDELGKLKGQVDNLNKALAEERRKRQEADRLVEYHEFQTRYRAGQGEPPPRRKEEDPDVAALRPIIQPLLDEALDPITVENRKVKADLSEQRARLRYKDYDKVVGEFLPAMQRDPFLMEMFYKSPDPAEFAYRQAIMINWDKFMESAKEEGRQEVVKKLEKGREAPTSLSKEAGARPAGEGEITLEQAARLSPEAWAALPEKTRRRLLGL